MHHPQVQIGGMIGVWFAENAQEIVKNRPYLEILGETTHTRQQSVSNIVSRVNGC